ncbi:MAG: isoaspartyl peptidase/L-asparaginase [Bacteroidetes bacterium]|nr:isoaspartyl peptidase/L-asparaginase [Bacteroidota bacterium]MDA0878897.1 isoaspartyl peptidase/L-asparaginase [Bacteroidota bacterium]MDA1115115.1 isoaspartyl peptidase/L-asparaginase [Bacteroidota bacterium]
MLTLNKFTATVFLCVLMMQLGLAPTKPKAVLVVHGGAGTILKEQMTDSIEQLYREKLSEALLVGREVIRKGGTSVDAVVAVIEILEDSPLFNAGKGAVFTAEGKNELDASIMDGGTGMAGAVASLTHVKNPIKAARAVMEHSEHVMMIGSGAEKFVTSQGIEMVPEDYFFTQKRFDQHRKALGEAVKAEPIQKKYGTVGAVALDGYGNLAAGTSTGGMTNKQFGRVGDAPIIGAGTYASNASCAVSATGHGEFFIRNVVAYDIAALMTYKNVSVEQASEAVINGKLKAINGGGGVIALDREGNFTMPFNTPGMYRGFISLEGEPQVFIYGAEEE